MGAQARRRTTPGTAALHDANPWEIVDRDGLFDANLLEK
jgi:hypothetical protein